MIYFIYGADSYRSREKLREIIEGYRQKYGNFLNFSRIDAEDKNSTDLKIAGKSQSLFSPKQMLIVENVFSSDDKTFEYILKTSEAFRASDDILVLWDGSELPPEKFLKKLTKISNKNQEFKKLDSAGLNLWLVKECEKRKINPHTFSQEGVGIKLADYKSSLLNSCGEDLWCLKNELDKIEVGGFTAPNPRREEIIFNLSDNFLKNKKEAIHSLVNLLKSGEDEFGLFSFIAGHFRNLLKVGSAMKAKKPLEAITADLKLHPYIIKKAAVEAVRRDESFFRKIFYRIFKEDLACKTGESTPAVSLVKLLFFRSE